MATRDLLVIWADYNSGGLIITLLPYDFCCQALPQFLVADDHKNLRATEAQYLPREAVLVACGMVHEGF